MSTKKNKPPLAAAKTQRASGKLKPINPSNVSVGSRRIEKKSSLEMWLAKCEKTCVGISEKCKTTSELKPKPTIEEWLAWVKEYKDTQTAKSKDTAGKALDEREKQKPKASKATNLEAKLVFGKGGNLTEKKPREQKKDPKLVAVETVSEDDRMRVKKKKNALKVQFVDELSLRLKEAEGEEIRNQRARKQNKPPLLRREKPIFSLPRGFNASRSRLPPTDVGTLQGTDPLFQRIHDKEKLVAQETTKPLKGLKVNAYVKLRNFRKKKSKPKAKKVYRLCLKKLVKPFAKWTPKHFQHTQHERNGSEIDFEVTQHERNGLEIDFEVTSDEMRSCQVSRFVYEPKNILGNFDVETGDKEAHFCKKSRFTGGEDIVLANFTGESVEKKEKSCPYPELNILGILEDIFGDNTKASEPIKDDTGQEESEEPICQEASFMAGTEIAFESAMADAGRKETARQKRLSGQRKKQTLVNRKKRNEDSKALKIPAVKAKLALRPRKLGSNIAKSHNVATHSLGEKTDKVLPVTRALHCIAQPMDEVASNAYADTKFPENGSLVSVLLSKPIFRPNPLKSHFASESMHRFVDLLGKHESKSEICQRCSCQHFNMLKFFKEANSVFQKPWTNECGATRGDFTSSIQVSGFSKTLDKSTRLENESDKMRPENYHQPVEDQGLGATSLTRKRIQIHRTTTDNIWENYQRYFH